MTRRSKIASTAFALAIVIAVLVAFVIHITHRNYGVPPELVPPEWTEFHTSAGHRAHVDDHDIPCKACHDFEKVGFKNPGVAPCVSCHKTENAHTHLFGALHPQDDCLTCHAFSPKPTPTCISCHAKTQDKHAAIGVHADVACTSCHKPHGDPSIVPANCTTCHAELTPSHADHADSRGCLDCHTGHAPAVAAKTSCASCHVTPAGPKPANHDSCLSCHKPHDFVAGGEKACIGCHGVKATLAADSVPAHDDCLSCHTPHDPTQAANSCAGCHANVHTNHPAVASMGTVASASVCTTCHAPHSGSNAIASACSSCHASIAVTDTAAHFGASCTTCHAPHDFGRPANNPAFCGTCHAREQTLAATNVGHSDCTRCHGGNPHEPVRAPSCSTCHAQEHATAPSGHQACTSCHDAHSGARNATTTCATCHAKESHDTHAIAVGNCLSCHRPHGPSGIATPPTCATCHARTKLAGLHSENAHATCASCHTPHEPARSDRATCTSTCHTDKRSHQPQATACSGCHVFR